jgi:hypothetical protein
MFSRIRLPGVHHYMTHFNRIFRRQAKQVTLFLHPTFVVEEYFRRCSYTCAFRYLDSFPNRYSMNEPYVPTSYLVSWLAALTQVNLNSKPLTGECFHLGDRCPQLHSS